MLVDASTYSHIIIIIQVFLTWLKKQAPLRRPYTNSKRWILFYEKTNAVSRRSFKSTPHPQRVDWRSLMADLCGIGVDELYSLTRCLRNDFVIPHMDSAVSTHLEKDRRALNNPQQLDLWIPTAIPVNCHSLTLSDSYQNHEIGVGFWGLKLSGAMKF